MGLDEQSVLDRFYTVLLREVGSRYLTDPNAPMAVVDIKHNLVPFHIRRDELGISTIAEYDRALLRLLDGQGGYLRLGSETARRRIRNHFDSSDPDPGVLREFLSDDVHLNPVLQDSEKPAPFFESCPSCQERLPHQSEVKFCPFCGDDLRRTLCASCGQKLRLTWYFCATCGAGSETERTH